MNVYNCTPKTPIKKSKTKIDIALDNLVGAPKTKKNNAKMAKIENTKVLSSETISNSDKTEPEEEPDETIYLKEKCEFKENPNRKYDYIFTLFYDIAENKSLEETQEIITNLFKKHQPHYFKYITGGFEICPETKRYHVQGYLHYGNNKYSMSMCVKFFKEINELFKPWLSERYFGIKRAVDYCHKGEQEKKEWKKFKHEGKNFGLNAKIFSFGTKPIDIYDCVNLIQTKWSKLKNELKLRNQRILNCNDEDTSKQLSKCKVDTTYIHQLGLDMIDDVEAGMSEKEIILRHLHLYLKCNMAFEKLLIKFAPERKKFKMDSYLFWQQELITKYLYKKDARRLIWIFSRLGKCGKSELIKELEDQEGFLVLSSGKSDDMFYMWEPNRPICMNIERSVETVLNYTAIEACRDGRVNSKKYVPVRKITDEKYRGLDFICFANFLPDFKSMSPDRWQIIELKKPSDDLNEIYIVEHDINQHVEIKYDPYPVGHPKYKIPEPEPIDILDIVFTA